MTPASSLWPQLLVPRPRCWHCTTDASSPLHTTSSSQMSPSPSPKKADPLAARAAPHCSSLQTTRALARVQPSSHTVPHLLPWKISTRPEQRDAPDNLMFSQPGRGTKAKKSSGGDVLTQNYCPDLQVHLTCQQHRAQETCGRDKAFSEL